MLGDECESHAFEAHPEAPCTGRRAVGHHDIQGATEKITVTVVRCDSDRIVFIWEQRADFVLQLERRLVGRPVSESTYEKRVSCGGHLIGKI